MKRIILLITLILASNYIALSQRVNAYARVTSISGTTLSLANVDEGDDTFEIGERLIIMQMQDDVIGGNTNNNSSFGNLGSIQSAGLFEIRTVSAIVESGTTPTSITLSTALGNTYNTGTNSRVQIISFPQLGSPDFTTTQDMNGKSWDGNTGGVFAFEVTEILTIEDLEVVTKMLAMQVAVIVLLTFLQLAMHLLQRVKGFIEIQTLDGMKQKAKY